MSSGDGPLPSKTSVPGLPATSVFRHGAHSGLARLRRELDDSASYHTRTTTPRRR